jgi:hypothetical protein
MWHVSIAMVLATAATAAAALDSVAVSQADLGARRHSGVITEHLQQLSLTQLEALYSLLDDDGSGDVRLRPPSAPVFFVAGDGPVPLVPARPLSSPPPSTCVSA